jgi:hypothetical protein
MPDALAPLPGEVPGLVGVVGVVGAVGLVGFVGVVGFEVPPVAPEVEPPLPEPPPESHAAKNNRAAAHVVTVSNFMPPS